MKFEATFVPAFPDGEPFWGSDGLAMIERWLAEGPW